MTILTVDSVRYTIGVTTIIDNISFSVNEGDRLGIVGVNGSGKTTLLSIIIGDIFPDEGNVFVAKGKTVGILRQNEVFHPVEGYGDTVLSQMYGAFPRLVSAEKRLSELETALAETPSESPEYERLMKEHDSVNKFFTENGGLYYKSRCASILSRLGFDESFHSLSPTALSGGQRTRLALVRLLLSEPDVLILDEPTNHLDIDALAWLESFLSDYKKTVMVVSHDRYFLDRVTNKILEIEHKRSKLYNTSYSGYADQKRHDREVAARHYATQQREIKRQLDFIEQQRRFGRERNFITIRSREKYLERMQLVDKPDALPKSIRFRLEASGRSGNDVLDVRGLTMAYGENVLFRDLDFYVKRLDRLFISGANGCGKSTLIKLLIGSLDALDGVIEYGYNVEIGYYDQENQNLDGRNSVIEELWGEYPSLTQTEVRNALARFLFVGDDIEKPVSVLSGGERARLTFCKLILSRVNLLILDEPTNHLDIQSREALEDALMDFDGTIIAVSHDRYFIDKLSTRILPLTKTGSKVWEGGYSDYISHLKSSAIEMTSTDTSDTASTNKEKYLASKKEAAEKRKKQRAAEKLAADIKAAEDEIESIDKELFGDAATDYVRAAELDARKTELEEALMLMYEEQEEMLSEE